jgi:hypothetical protein
VYSAIRRSLSNTRQGGAGICCGCVRHVQILVRCCLKGRSGSCSERSVCARVIRPSSDVRSRGHGRAVCAVELEAFAASWIDALVVWRPSGKVDKARDSRPPHLLLETVNCLVSQGQRRELSSFAQKLKSVKSRQLFACLLACVRMCVLRRASYCVCRCSMQGAINRQQMPREIKIRNTEKGVFVPADLETMTGVEATAGSRRKRIAHRSWSCSFDWCAWQQPA